MPEGDTIHRVARDLGPDLVGRTLSLLEVGQRLVPWGAEATVSGCRAVGKHLVIALTTPVGPRHLRVHLGMKGGWQRYRHGEAWRRPKSQRRLVLATDAWIFVCSNAKEVELGRGEPKQLRRLGPDLLAPAEGAAEALDLATIVANARERDRPLGELLLDQRVVSGIGNVYKCEALFLERLEPWRLASSLDDVALGALYSRAQALMAENLARGGWRTTTPRGAGPSPGHTRHWVYRRAGRPCRVCGAAIGSRLQGAQARMTYWCPRCQR